jgi:hypothetical protein
LPNSSVIAFLQSFRADRHPLRLFSDRARFEGTPVFTVYRSGCRELVFQLLGADEVDENVSCSTGFRAKDSPGANARRHRSDGARGRRVRVAPRVADDSAGHGSERRAVSRLLGTVWGVMDTFGGVAMAGSANLAAMAPGVSAALITTVTGLLVAIPAMFGYNYLVTTLRGMVVELDNFAAELASEFEHKYVDHGERTKSWTHP